MSINDKIRNNNNMLDDDMDEEMEDTQEDKYLTFVLNREEYGIEIKHVIEIIGIQNITSIPDMPQYIKGVINLRGKVIPVMDVRMRFNISEQAYNERTCIIVITVSEQLVGLIVDEVSEVLDIPKTSVEPSPKVNRGEGSKFVQGMGKIGDAVKILLNVDKLLFEEDLEKIAAL